MNCIFADTYFYIAFLNPEDEAHQTSVDFMEGFEGEIITTEWVLTELANGFAIPDNRGRFVNFHAMLRNDPSVTINPATSELFDEGLRLYSARLDKEWSLTDCISFVVMKDNGLSQALTADHHFRQAGFKALLG